MVDRTEIGAKKYWWRNDKHRDSCSVYLLPGNLCPECGRGTVDYDGLFILSCKECGYIADNGAFT